MDQQLLPGSSSIGAQTDHQLQLSFHDTLVDVRSNRAEVIEYLSSYFTGFVSKVQSGWQLQIVVVGHDAIEVPWPGSRPTGVPETWRDEDDVRIVHNARSGLLFSLGESVSYIVGPCTAHLGHVARFICSRYYEHRLLHQAVAAHAAAVMVNDRAVVLSAPGGGGKTTAALALLRTGQALISNDRIAVERRPIASEVMVYGVPRRCTIGPGTALAIPELARVLSDSERATYAAMEPQELRSEKQKFEIATEEYFKKGFSVAPCPVGAMVSLNYGTEDEPVSCERVLLQDRRDVIAPLIEPEPVFRSASADRAGVFVSSEEVVASALEHVPWFEIRGRRDIADVTRALQQLLVELA